MPNVGAGQPSLLKELNERSVLEVIHQEGRVPRSVIAARTGLSKPTISQALSTLLASELVVESGKATGGKGPNASLYELNPRSGCVVGIDVGHEWLRAAVADITGTMRGRTAVQTDLSSNCALVEQIGNLARRVTEDAGVAWEQVTYTTIGSPGVLDPGSRAVVMAPNIPGWERTDLIIQLRSELGTNLSLENDVNLAALGEKALGNGRNVSDFVFLWIGTGVGLGLVLNGELYRGSAGAAGEIAYFPVGGADVRAASARRGGAFEHAAGADGVVRMAHETGLQVTTAKEVFELARNGDRQALKVVTKEAVLIALGIAVVAPLLDPEMIILGGGIGRNVDLLLPPLERELEAISRYKPRLVASALGEDVVLHGAIAIALQEARELVFERRTRRGQVDGT